MNKQTTKASNPKDVRGVEKVPMSTLSAPVMMEVGLAMLEGAAKYGRHNYRKVGVRSSVYYDAAMRHLIAWFEGEDIDTESGLSHLAKVMSTMMVLRDAQIRGKLNDDRPPGTSGFIDVLNEKTKAFLESCQTFADPYLADGPPDKYKP